MSGGRGAYDCFRKQTLSSLLNKEIILFFIVIFTLCHRKPKARCLVVRERAGLEEIWGGISSTILRNEMDVLLVDMDDA